MAASAVLLRRSDRSASRHCLRWPNRWAVWRGWVSRVFIRFYTGRCNASRIPHLNPSVFSYCETEWVEAENGFLKGSHMWESGESMPRRGAHPEKNL